MTPKCPDCRRDQEDCICFPSAKMKRTIDRQSAHIEMMRVALQSAEWNSLDLPQFVVTQIVEALSSTPDQALEQFAAKVRSQCESVARSGEWGLTKTGKAIAAAIGRLKELP